MKFAVLGIFGVIILSVSTSAQVSPVPVIDSEVRDNQSIRMRSLEIERAERGSNKPPRAEISKEAQIIFARISDDFETIQKLQTSIVRAYTSGGSIDYGRINGLAIEMRKRAVRFSVDFFNTDAETKREEDSGPTPSANDDVRDLVIQLDKTIGDFVTNPVFDKAVVDSRSVEKAELELHKIISLSERLSREAGKLK